MNCAAGWARAKMTRRKRLLGRKSGLGEAIFLSVGVKIMVINVFTRVFFLSYTEGICAVQGEALTGHWIVS